MDVEDSNLETDLLVPPILKATDEAEANADVEPRSGQEPEEGWELTHSVFHRLLDWLGGGEMYLEMRRRLISYFVRKGCQSPEDLADETLNRVARRLEEEGSITEPEKFCFCIARYVFLEYFRKKSKEQSLDDLLDSGRPIDDLVSSYNPDDDWEEQEKLLACLRRCMEKLNPASGELIIQYYQGEKRVKIKNRRELASKLGISMAALRIRAGRIRRRLEDCISDCAGLR